jgi:thymidylate synthase ThyX
VGRLWTRGNAIATCQQVTHSGNLARMEKFSPEEEALLSHFVTSTRGPVYALKNLPEVVKGALFSRYSRAKAGVRTLLLKEFLARGDVSSSESGLVDVKRAQDFYDRILDGYGDDSIGELGGAHLAVERASMLAAKALEDLRIGGSPLEKSTRYVTFEQKVDGHYMYYRDPVLMASAFRDQYLNCCDKLFQVYEECLEPLTRHIEQQFQPEPGTSPQAYTAALRAKVCDCLRGLLPAGTMTNLGIYGNGRFFESLLQRLHGHRLAEMREIGQQAFDQLHQIIPSFIRRGTPAHPTLQAFNRFKEATQARLQAVARRLPEPDEEVGSEVRLIDWDPQAPIKVAAALLFSSTHHSLESLRRICAAMPQDELDELLASAASAREQRRHKSPRALENSPFTFELLSDFGTYRDLQRHRLLTQERQLLTCLHGYELPSELEEAGLAKKVSEALDEAAEVWELISQELPEEAQYLVPMAYRVRWYFHVNLRELQWICELRSQPAGHTVYRRIAQEMARQVAETLPPFERFFAFVDHSGHDLGRLGQEERRIRKQAKASA